MTGAPDRSQRARFADAGMAQREAMRRLAAVEITGKQTAYWQITAMTISLVASYSRVSDTVRRSQIAEVCGVVPKTVSRALEWAAAHGVLTWTEDKAGGAWRVTLPTPWTEDAGKCPGVEAETLDSSESHLSSPPGQVTQGSVQPSEKTPEKENEENPPGGGDFWASQPLTVRTLVDGLPVDQRTADEVSEEVARRVDAEIPLEALQTLLWHKIRDTDNPQAAIRARLRATRGMDVFALADWVTSQRWWKVSTPTPRWMHNASAVAS